MVTVYYRVFRSGLVLSLHVSAPEHIWPDDVSAVNVASLPKGDVTASQPVHEYISCRCRSAVRQKTSMAMATVNLPTVNGYARWPARFNFNFPIFNFISEISWWKIAFPWSLFQRVAREAGVKWGPSWRSRSSNCCHWRREKVSEEFKTFPAFNFFHKHWPRDLLPLGFGSPPPPYFGEHKNKMKVKPGRKPFSQWLKFQGWGDKVKDFLVGRYVLNLNWYSFKLNENLEIHCRSNNVSHWDDV